MINFLSMFSSRWDNTWLLPLTWGCCDNKGSDRLLDVCGHSVITLADIHWFQYHWNLRDLHWAALGNTESTLELHLIYTGQHWNHTESTLCNIESTRQLWIYTGTTLNLHWATLDLRWATLNVCADYTGQHWIYTGQLLTLHWNHTESTLSNAGWIHTGQHWLDTGATVGSTENNVSSMKVHTGQHWEYTEQN
jgi:hypothetical protein